MQSFVSHLERHNVARSRSEESGDGEVSARCALQQRIATVSTNQSVWSRRERLRIGECRK